MKSAVCLVLGGLSIGLLAFTVGVARASDFPSKTYTSPSGLYTLRVDPSQRSGGGEASYKLDRESEAIWSGKHPFTFWDAFVTDDGLAGGYAYSEGYFSESGEFIVALLDPNGTVRQIDKTPREWSHFLHVTGDPKAAGLFVSANTNRFVVRVEDSDLNAEQESWWTYHLEDGHLLGKSKPVERMPADAAKQAIVAARPVSGTPLTLIHWLRYESDDTDSCSSWSARFTLVDTENKPVWTLNLPGDYTKCTDERAEFELVHNIREHGGILDASQPAEFVIRHAAADKQVTYAVSRDATATNNWTVSERAREAFAGTAKIKATAKSEAAPPTMALERLSSISLVRGASDDQRSAVRDVLDFSPGEAGRFGILRQTDGNEIKGLHSLVIVDGDGRLVREIALPKFLGGDHFVDHLAWNGGDKWIVTTSGYDNSDVSSAVRIDASNGSVTKIGSFSAPMISALASFSDGGFVVLATESKLYTRETSVIAFDELGKKRWAIKEGDKEGELFSPEAIAVVSTGEVAVLENISYQLEIYDADGHFQRTLSLQDSWGRKPNYPTGLNSDGVGGVVVHDFQGASTIVRMSLAGTVNAEFTPTYKDGRKFDITGDAKATPSGELWTSDGQALLKLDEHGVVTRVVGHKPDVVSLGRIAAVSVTPESRIHAVDERTGAVHVFDKNGKPEHVGKPELDDYNGKLISPSLTVSDRGDVYVARNVSRGNTGIDFLHYDSAGKRIGVESLAMDEVSQEWISQPGTENRWVLGFERAYLVGADKNVLRRLDRAANQRWVENPGPGSAAADGSIAIVSGIDWDLDGDVHGEALVTVFSASGNAEVTWKAPARLSASAGGIGFDGQHVAFVIQSADSQRSTSILVTDKQGNPQFNLPLADASYEAAVFFVKADKIAQLWVFDGRSSIERYVLPWK